MKRVLLITAVLGLLSTACDEDSSCNGPCPTGLTECDGRCVNLNTNRSNCGTCGNACGDGMLCSMGSCEVTCQTEPVFLTVCEDNDDGIGNNNGDCEAGEECVCADLTTDRDHCGACNNVCLSGQVCQANICVLSCPTGFSECVGACRDLMVDPENCGSCGYACNSDEYCLAGTCTPACP